MCVLVNISLVKKEKEKSQFLQQIFSQSGVNAIKQIVAIFTTIISYFFKGSPCIKKQQYFYII